MTTLETRTGHPLAMTTEAEVTAVRDVLTDVGLLTENVRYAFFAPEEPAKDEVLAHPDGASADRRFRAVLLDISTGRSWDTVVSATSRTLVSSRELEPATDGQPPIIDTEFELIEGILNENARLAGRAGRPGHRARLGARGAAVGRRLRLPGGGRPADRARVRLPAGPREGPPVGAPDRRAGRLRRPDRALGRPGDRHRCACRCRPRPATSTTPRSRVRRWTRSSRSRSPSRRAARSPWTTGTCAGASGTCGSGSTSVRA